MPLPGNNLFSVKGKCVVHILNFSF
uniref:Uncharacterized protein n=1 Tax=Rhizophora mucronata TaxID=61149 RepID=A0A2P2MXK5_RHIMU